MTKHKITFNESELGTLRYALCKLLKETDEQKRIWTDFGEDAPDFLKEQYDELEDLYNKLCIF